MNHIQKQKVHPLSCNHYKLSHFDFSMLLSSKIFLEVTSIIDNIYFAIVFSCLTTSRQRIQRVYIWSASHKIYYSYTGEIRI